MSSRWPRLDAEGERGGEGRHRQRRRHHGRAHRHRGAAAAAVERLAGAEGERERSEVASPSSRATSGGRVDARAVMARRRGRVQRQVVAAPASRMPRNTASMPMPMTATFTSMPGDGSATRARPIGHSGESAIGDHDARRSSPAARSRSCARGRWRSARGGSCRAHAAPGDRSTRRTPGATAPGSTPASAASAISPASSHSTTAARCRVRLTLVCVVGLGERRRTPDAPPPRRATSERKLVEVGDVGEIDEEDVVAREVAP